MGFFGTIWSWIYHGSGFLLIYFTLACIVKSLYRTPMRKVQFIEKAIKDNRVALGKVSSYVVHSNPLVHEVEYAYSVNDKVYFTTYVLNEPTEKINPLDEIQPGDGIATTVPSTLTVYYDAVDPKKTVIKKEVFASRGGVKWKKTKKKNKHRDIYKDWTGPIVL
jgi:hypothetical protein